MQYVSECISTIQQMCTNGLGHPKVPFLFKQEIESKSEVNIQDFISQNVSLEFAKLYNSFEKHLDGCLYSRFSSRLLFLLSVPENHSSMICLSPAMLFFLFPIC